jgi:3-hydroxyisobutyrate dehydrogenase-like beta-hydroxyacid dehydrogenase
MTPVIAIIAPGAMGAAVGKRLADNGLKVLTSLAGRSEETAARAKAAGMADANDKEIAAADFILSILPPGDALALAERFAPALQASNAKPVYVDCNAINPATVERVMAAIAPTECPFVDAGIIGSPPSPLPNPPPPAGEGRVAGSPRFYASGPSAQRFARLRDYGLDVRVLGGAMSAASALKMSYAGITKGTQAIGPAMMLAAMRSGSADDLLAELQSSQKQLFPWLKRQLELMPPKAYRWVAEMQEIAGFVADDPAARDLYEGAAHFYERFAEDSESGDGKAAAALEAFLGKSSS